jgi:hypothetical protein
VNQQDVMRVAREFEAACEQGREALRAHLESELAPAHRVVHEVLEGDDASIMIFGVRESITAARIAASARAFDYFIEITAMPEDYTVPLVPCGNCIKPGRQEWRVVAHTGSQEGPVVWSCTVGDPLALMREAGDWVRAGRSLEQWAR